MQIRYSQFLVALQSAQQFLDANDKALGTINTTSARQSLNTAAEQISKLADTQDGQRMHALNARKTETRLAAELRRKLMRPIARVAKAKLPKETELGNIHVTPANASTMALVSRARAMADFVEAHPSAFTDLGPALAQRVRDAVTEVERSITGKTGHRGSRVGATKEIVRQVTEARRLVGVLDSLVRAQVDEGDTIVVQWRDAVREIRGRKRASTRPATAQPVPAPSPTTPLPQATEAPKAQAA